MIPDPLEKKIKIPIKIVGGKILFFYGGELPRIRDGVIGDLIIPAYAIKNPEQLDVLTGEHAEEILPADQTLIAQIRVLDPRELGEREKQYIVSVKKRFTGLPSQFDDTFYPVEIKLLSPLRLRLRGTKDADLLDCECYLVALDEPATSINHAFTRISETFEKHRISHGGNVFNKVFYQEAGAAGWLPLGNLRNRFEADDEQSLLSQISGMADNKVGHQK